MFNIGTEIILNFNLLLLASIAESLGTELMTIVLAGHDGTSFVILLLDWGGGGGGETIYTVHFVLFYTLIM
jgi:hypothetical protein